MLPSVKVTVPVGMSPRLPETVAVNVMGVPYWQGLEDVAKDVFVLTAVTDSVTAEDVAPRLFGSPVYAAVI
jgi:hypothetical protein